MKFAKKLTSNFAVVMLLAAILGFAAGMIVGEPIGVIKPLGTIFSRLLSMLVPLLVFFSISSAFANIGDAKKLGKWAGKVIGWFMITTIIGAVIGIIVGFIFRPGEGLSLPHATYEATEITADTFIEWLPSNALGCLAEGNTIQIVFLSLFVGLAAVFMKDGKEKEAVKTFLNSAQALVLQIVKGIMYYAPIGIFALMASSIADIRGALIVELSSFLACLTTGFIVHILLCYILLFAAVTRLNPFKFIKKLAPALITACSTCSSSATMPVTLNCMKDAGVDEEITSFGIPLGVTFNMDAQALEVPVEIMLGMFAVGITPNLSQLVMFVLLAIVFSIGCAGIPGSGIAIAVILCNTFGLPTEVVAWIAAVFFYIDVWGTTINVWGDAVSTAITARTEGLLDIEKFNS